MSNGSGAHWELETDVVCVGSGLAGCAAALAAADHDFEVMVLEKDSQYGGTTTSSDGRMWIPGNDLARDAGIADSIDEGQAYLRFLAGGGTVDGNLIAYVDKASAGLRYFTQLWLRFQLVRNVPDIDFGTAPGAKAEGRIVEIAPFPAGGEMLVRGAGLIAAFVKTLHDRSERITLDAPARRLVVEDERVTGLLAEIEGREVAIRTRFGVVLASDETLQAMGASAAGLLTNARGQVIDPRGNAIPGLYATGECAAAPDFGIDGLPLGRSLIFSLAAVRHMLAGTGQERLV